MCKLLATISLIITLLAGISSGRIYGQDTERPLPPFLENITVDPLTGYCTLSWVPGGSPDVAAYVLYNYRDGAGEAFDTIFNPFAISYIDTKSNANLFSVSYLMAAIDSSDNISPLSNNLNTLYITAALDSCNHGIKAEWNSFNSENHTIDSYTLFTSIDGGPYNAVGITQPTDTFLFITSIVTGSEYCFVVKASLDGSMQSASNSECINTNLIRPPDWINGDFATIENEKLILSFSFDQLSEIETFRIEDSNNPNSGYSPVLNLNSNTGTISHSLSALPVTPRFYKVSALNNCGIPVITSNPVSVLITKLTDNNNAINLSWNNYIDWVGGVDHYSVFRYTGDSFTEIGATVTGDTIWIDDLYNFLYDISGDSICYQVIAYEGSNPYYSGAESRSTTICTPSPVRIFAPTMFTPDGDGINDTFKPVMSFTPKKYRLVIKNRGGVTLFESSNYLQEWNGLYRGKSEMKDVYFWFLEIETESGRTISRHGTITIF